eukprot:1647942-Amphidinium_carterae.1
MKLTISFIAGNASCQKTERSIPSRCGSLCNVHASMECAHAWSNLSSTMDLAQRQCCLCGSLLSKSELNDEGNVEQARKQGSASSFA